MQLCVTWMLVLPLVQSGRLVVKTSALTSDTTDTALEAAMLAQVIRLCVTWMLVVVPLVRRQILFGRTFCADEIGVTDTGMEAVRLLES